MTGAEWDADAAPLPDTEADPNPVNLLPPLEADGWPKENDGVGVVEGAALAVADPKLNEGTAGDGEGEGDADGAALPPPPRPFRFGSPRMLCA